jgi:hypothetical protein
LGKPEGLTPIYNRTRIAASDVVIVVEGEKCVHALAGAGHVATTSPGGAGKAGLSDWAPLAGKRLYLWPDNDNGGIKHMKQVHEIVTKLDPAPNVFWVEPEEVVTETKADAADFLGAISEELRYEAIETVVGNAKPLGASSGLWNMLRDTMSGKRAAIDMPWPKTGEATWALLPGTVTLLCGDPGASKSFMMIQAAMYWYRNGIKSALYELEDDKAYHLARVLAQVSGVSDVTNPKWVLENAEDVERLMTEYQELLDAFAANVYAAPEQQLDYNSLLEWSRARATDGCRVIAIDPITAVKPKRDTWVADAEFIFAIKTIARQYGCSVVLVTHPKKGRSGAGLDDLAGGASFARFAQTILWLQYHKEPVAKTVGGPLGRMKMKFNRTLHLVKVRNSDGHGLQIAYNFDISTLTLAEQGPILPDKKTQDERE